MVKLCAQGSNKSDTLNLKSLKVDIVFVVDLAFTKPSTQHQNHNEWDKLCVYLLCFELQLLACPDDWRHVVT